MKIGLYIQPSEFGEGVVVSEDLEDIFTSDSEVAVILERGDHLNSLFNIVIDNDENQITVMPEAEEQRVGIFPFSEGMEAILPFKDEAAAHRFAKKLQKAIIKMEKVRLSDT